MRYVKLGIRVAGREVTRFLEARPYTIMIGGSTVSIFNQDGALVDRIELPQSIDGAVRAELVPEDNGFVFKVDGETLDSLETGGVRITAEPASGAEAEIVSGVTGAAAMASEAASEEATPVNKYVMLSEDIARATTESIKIQLESLHASGVVPKPVVIPATAYTKMFMFLSKLSVTATSTRDEVIKEITANLGDFEDVVRTIARDSETLERGVWVRLEKESVELRRILKMLDSRVVVDMMREAAVEARAALASNDPERIMRAYAMAVRLVGLIAPGVIGERPEEYYSRLDKVLLEGEAPRTRLEHIVKKVFEPMVRRRGEAGAETGEHRGVAASVGA